MTKKDIRGIAFGFGLVIIWLLVLTNFVVRGTMSTDTRQEIILIPPPQTQLEPVEFDIIEEGV